LEEKARSGSSTIKQSKLKAIQNQENNMAGPHPYHPDPVNVREIGDGGTIPGLV